MWLTSYDSCSSCSVINHKSKIHPKPTLPWDFKQWWALDSPIFLLCPPGLIRADESKNSTCALCTPQNVPQGDFFFSDTLFLYLLIPQFPSRTTGGSFCKWKMCFVFFFLAYHLCKTKWETITSKILIRLLFLMNSHSTKNHRSIHCWVVQTPFENSELKFFKV